MKNKKLDFAEKWIKKLLLKELTYLLEEKGGGGVIEAILFTIVIRFNILFCLEQMNFTVEAVPCIDGNYGSQVSRVAIYYTNS